MINEKFIPYAQQHISPEDIAAVSEALQRPQITRGALVEEFEQAVANYCGAQFAVAFNSGTAALMAAYFAADTNQNDTLVSTPNTFVTSVSAGVQFCATPVFLDIDRGTGNISLEHLDININRQRARGKTIIMPVHFSGIPVDIQAIDHMITDPNTVIIEDAAHAIGSYYKDGTMVGCCGYSQMTMFSFHPAKTITTGEGGMVTTNDPELNRRLRLFRNNGIERDPAYMQNNAGPWFYEVQALTGNYNFTEMQAALGLRQLKQIDQFIKKRQKLLKLYAEKLKDIENVEMLAPKEPMEIAPHLCVVQIDYGAYKSTNTPSLQSKWAILVSTSRRPRHITLRP